MQNREEFQSGSFPPTAMVCGIPHEIMAFFGQHDFLVKTEGRVLLKDPFRQIFKSVQLEL